MKKLCLLLLAALAWAQPAFAQFNVPGQRPGNPIANLRSGVTVSGPLLETNVAAPTTPPTGKTFIYVDSTAKRLSSKNDAGTVAVDVVPDTGASNNFLTAISAAGVISKAQPSFSNLSGSATCAQLPALTGDTTSSAGSCATTLSAGNAANLNSGTLLAARMPALTGDVTTSAGAVATTIANNAVTLAKLATQATNTVLGNATSGTAVPTALAVGTCSTAASALNWTTNTGFGCNTSITANAVAVGGITGLGTGVATFLATPSSANLAAALTDETGTGAAVFGTSPTIASPAFSGTVTGANTIPLTILAQSAANTMLGNWTGSTANVAANAMPSCSDTGGNHLNYVSGTGITCGTSGGGSGVTSIATTSPITGGTITTTGTIACATCVTSAAALTANALVVGGGSQASAVLGSLGTTTTVLHGNAAGLPTFAAVVSADLNITTTTCTNQFVSAISAGAVGTCSTAAKPADQQTFAASGTWTKPSGFGAKAYVLIEGWGGGGGAGRGLALAATGGGGGAYKYRWILLSSLGATETVTIGAAGVGRTGSTGPGTAGGDTTFGSWLTAYGGGPGTGSGTGLAGGNGGGPHANAGYNGYTDGSAAATPNAIAYEGSPGGGNIVVPGKAIYGGGGGGGSSATQGTSQFGGAGGLGSTTTTATAGTVPGGGGGGNGTLNTDGKNGAAGQVTVTVFDGA